MLYFHFQHFLKESTEITVKYVKTRLLKLNTANAFNSQKLHFRLKRYQMLCSNEDAQ